MKVYLLPVIILSCFLFVMCKKKATDPQCIALEIVPYQPYSDPVWHPGGQLLGFNHTPQVGVYTIGSPPCEQYINSVNNDSAGFYIMNKNSSGFKRITNYYLLSPAWSPDGNWLAFSRMDGQIYKMRFDGENFDTANMVRLTHGMGNYNPSWTPEGDSIFYDSNADIAQQGYYVWKMDANGIGHTGIPGIGRDPYVGTNGKVYVGGGYEIFSVNRDGTGLTQETFNGNNNGTTTNTKSKPQYFEGSLFYEQNGIWSFNNNIPLKLVRPSDTYDISKNGEIVFSKTNHWTGNYDPQKGALWIMDIDGSNQRQLTFNNH